MKKQKYQANKEVETPQKRLKMLERKAQKEGHGPTSIRRQTRKSCWSPMSFPYILSTDPPPHRLHPRQLLHKAIIEQIQKPQHLHTL